jgi:hypothetical protein
MSLDLIISNPIGSKRVQLKQKEIEAYKEFNLMILLLH